MQSYVFHHLLDMITTAFPILLSACGASLTLVKVQQGHTVR